jgi:hypothetical protein
LNEIKDGNPRTRVQVECEHSYGHEHLLVGIFDIAASGSKRLDSNIVAERKAMMRMHTATRMRQRWKNRPNDSIKFVTAGHYKCDGPTRLLGSIPIVEHSDGRSLTANCKRHLQRSRGMIDQTLMYICQSLLRYICAKQIMSMQRHRYCSHRRASASSSQASIIPNSRHITQ